MMFQIYNPKHPVLEDKDSRLKTFAVVWRTDIEQTPELLVDAGFFYTGLNDFSIIQNITNI